MSITTEKTFESAIIHHLTEVDGWTLGDASMFDRNLAMFPKQVIAFLKKTQPKEWEKLEKVHGKDVEEKLLQRLVKELDQNGMLHVIRHGFTDYGIRFRMAFFKPESGLNPETLELYKKNLLHVTRQVHYSVKNENSLDLVLSLNGLPVATVEIKNHFTGQTVANARKQFMYDRDPRDPIFVFKKRTLVHFAVDPDEVYMTTKLAGKETYYLPFNKGNGNGKGNPVNPRGYKTAYLWEEVWQRDSWMDILAKFIMLQVEEIEDKTTGKKFKKETMLFPRYHQLDAVRKLTRHSKEKGAGSNYLIQHSAGSGKSNSIAWLAYRLSSLHDASDKRVFDIIVVVTDRKVLDQQLQNNIYDFEHKTGVVQKIDKDSTQLATALESGTNIIITTLQKFPYIIGRIGALPDRRYAIIVDEAHSSQGGEASKKMKEVLKVEVSGGNYSEEEVLEAALESDDADGTDAEDYIRESMSARGQQGNLSFFAFTATPKPKTLEVFGSTDYAHPELDKNGRIIPKPFHLYSMRQAIEEGFIHDVLKNYTTYELYFKLSKAITDDPELNKKKAAIAIGRFVSLHPHNIAQKTEIIIEHFRQVVHKKIGGKAKAMVVTGSRLHAVRYYFAFKKYIAEKGYSDIRPLVAFSGKVIDEGYPQGVTEVELNKFGERELPEKFATEEYQLLLVADKYQTGFDQPLLHTMYVDKKLNGVKAVQTLSRLNRTCPGKEDTFVLDFANDRETILNSFQPYFELTKIEERTDPNLMYDLKNKLDAKQVYWQSEIDGLAQVFFNPKYKDSDQAKLYAYIDPAVDRFKALDEEPQDEFKRHLTQWLRLYSFLSQIIPFQDAELEKFFAYGRLLQTKLPKLELSERLKLTDEVAMQYYRLQKVSEGSIVLQPQGEYGLQGSTETGMQREKEEKAKLSEIITVLNDRFGTEFTQADQLYFDQIKEELSLDHLLRDQAMNNTEENFKFGLLSRFDEIAIERMEQNQEIFTRLFDDADFGKFVRNWMVKSVYEKIRTNK
jgi:type I restriction enzyme R subunit